MKFDQFDKRISACMLDARCHRPALDMMADAVARYAIFVLAAVALLRTGSAPVIASLVAWPLCIGLEILIQRPRPFQAFKQAPLAKYWTPTPSFPSAHATIGFALAGAVYLQHPSDWPLFLVAAAIAVSRVYVGVHYLSDILAGAAIGFGVSFALSLI